LKRLYGAGIGRVRQYVNNLETVLIQVLDDFAIEGLRFQGHRGVWVKTASGMKKIAAIGIHVSASGISSHGFALNVDPDLDHFSGIVPCGIHDYGVTSMAAILGKRLTITEVFPGVIDAFSEVLSLEIVSKGVQYAYH
jgi:lipoate-protein ligase B